MKRELEALIKGMKNSSHPEIPNCLAGLFAAVSGLDTMFADYAKGTRKLSLVALKNSYAAVFAALDDVDSKIRAYRTDPRLKVLIPQGYSKLASKIKRVTVDMHTVSVAAPKSERVGARELTSMFRTSFPTLELYQLLIDSAKRVKQSRLSAKLGDSSSADAEIKKLAGSYSKFYSKLPMRLNGVPFKAFKMPITPLFEDMSAQFEPERLERAGMDVTRIGDGYIVLENQVLLAFDHDAMGWKSGMKNVGGQTKILRLTGPKAERRGHEMEDDINNVLETINKQSSTKYALASKQLLPNPRNAKIWLAWVVPAAHRRSLEQALRTFEVSWGLPFNMDLDDD